MVAFNVTDLRRNLSYERTTYYCRVTTKVVYTNSVKLHVVVRYIHANVHTICSGKSMNVEPYAQVLQWTLQNTLTGTNLQIN